MIAELLFCPTSALGSRDVVAMRVYIDEFGDLKQGQVLWRPAISISGAHRRYAEDDVERY
jgi:hypothetical protein